MGREYELKYRADGDALVSIQEKYGTFTRIDMETSYYDTPDLKLAIRRWMLRKRLENGVAVCTLKTTLADGSRGEWEVENPSLMSAILQLCAKGAPQELIGITAGGVVQTCAAKFTRLAATLEIPGCTVELALDQGAFLGRGKEQPFAEVEVELKDGSEIAAVAFAEGMAKEFGLTPEPKSKVQRAMELMF